MPITKDDVVYICGPMSGIPDANRELFMRAEKALREKVGCRVLNPAHMPDGFSYRRYMAHALHLLSHATAVVSLPGSDTSLGAKIEMDCAGRDGIKVFKMKIIEVNTEVDHE